MWSSPRWLILWAQIPGDCNAESQWLSGKGILQDEYRKTFFPVIRTWTLAPVLKHHPPPLHTRRAPNG